MKNTKNKVFLVPEYYRYRQDFIIFFFICDINCIINEKESRNILFEVMVQSKILERLDLSYDFGQKLIVQNDDDTMRGHLIHHQKYAYTSRLKHYLTIFMH